MLRSGVRRRLKVENEVIFIYFSVIFFLPFLHYSWGFFEGVDYIDRFRSRYAALTVCGKTLKIPKNRKKGEGDRDTR